VRYTGFNFWFQIQLAPLQLGGKAKTYGGHSSHVTTVRFTRDGGTLFTAGGGDSTLMQWQVR
jgi:WD40 repeat protein